MLTLETMLLAWRLSKLIVVRVRAALPNFKSPSTQQLFSIYVMHARDKNRTLESTRE